jgi:hypothetical protein
VLPTSRGQFRVSIRKSGCILIARWRNNSAHLRRPWRASLRFFRYRRLGPSAATGCRIQPPCGSEGLDFDFSQPYISVMTTLLDEAMEVVRRLPSDDQDDIARAIMQLAGSDLAAPVMLSPAERDAIAHSKAAAGRGEFATDEQVRAVWAKHGL